MQDRLITTHEAAKIIGVSPKSVWRYIQGGLLEAKSHAKDKAWLRKSDVSRISNAKGYYDNLEKKVAKEAWVFHNSGHLGNSSLGTPCKLKLAMEYYEFMRNGQLQSYTAYPHLLYMVEEVAARLRIKGTSVVYEMIGDKVLQGQEFCFDKRKKMLVNAHSLHLYLGDNIGKRLYNVEFVAGLDGKSTHQVAVLAKKHDIGRKLNPARKWSRYRFNLEEAQKIISLQ